jgi:hypothetical protein
VALAPVNRYSAQNALDELIAQNKRRREEEERRRKAAEAAQRAARAKSAAKTRAAGKLARLPGDPVPGIIKAAKAGRTPLRPPKPAPEVTKRYYPKKPVPLKDQPLSPKLRTELKQISSVKSVRELQQRLNRAGYKVAVDGVMGPETTGAYNAWRKRVAKKFDSETALWTEQQKRRSAQKLRASIKLPPTSRDQSKLLARYGFLGAEQIKQARQDYNRMVNLALQGRSGTVQPRPEPPPGLLKQVVGGTIGRLFDLAEGGSGPRMGVAGAVPREVQAAGLGVGEVGQLAARAAQVWGVSAQSLLTHPERALGDIKDIAVGTGRALGALAAAPHDPGMLAEIGRAIVQDYINRYGENWREYAEQDPLWGLLDAAAVANIGGRVWSIGSSIPELGLRTAVRESFRPSAPFRLEHPKVGAADFVRPRSPLGRRAQELGGMISEILPERVPFSALQRVQKQQIKGLTREFARVQAARQDLINLVSNPAGVLNLDGRTRLFWEAQRAEDKWGSRGLQELYDGLLEAYAEPLPTVKLTPTETTLRAERQVRALQKVFDKLNEQRRIEIQKKTHVDPLKSQLRSLKQQRRYAPGEFERPMTIEEARARVSELDTKISDAVSSKIRWQYTDELRNEQLRRNRRNAQIREGERRMRGELTQQVQVSESRFGQLQVMPTVKEEMFQAGIDDIIKMADDASQPDNVRAAARGFKAMVEERKELMDALDDPAAVFGAQDLALPQVRVPSRIDEIDAEIGVIEAELYRKTKEMDGPLTEAQIVEWAGLLSASRDRVGGALSIAKDRLEQAWRREAQRNANLTVDGLQAKLVRQVKQAEGAAEGTARKELLTARAMRTAHDLAALRQRLELSEIELQANRQRTLDDLATAIEAGYADSERYESALRAAGELTQMLEDAQVELTLAPTDFIDDFARQMAEDEIRAVYQNRRGIIERFLGRNETADAFFTHDVALPKQTGVGRGVQGQVLLSSPDLSALKHSKKNELILLQSGRILADSRVMAVRAQKVAALEFVQYFRDIIRRSPAAEEIPVGMSPNKGWYLVKARGKILPKTWRDVIEGEAEPSIAVREYVEDIFQQVTEEDSRRLIMEPGVVQVPPEVVNGYMWFVGGKDMRGMVGTATKAGQTIDFAQNLVKLSVMYSNPGYYVANFLGNMVFLNMAYDPFSAFRSLYRSGKLHKQDARLWRRVAAEQGEGIAQSLLAETKGTGRLERGLKAQRYVANKAGTADRGPRVAAWLHEAAHEGVKSNDEIRVLLDSTDAAAVAKRARITERARRAMVDFDSMTQPEKMFVRRVIFVYPWLRGSSKWAKDFVLDRPERASVLAHTTSGVNQAWEEAWGGQAPDLPTWLQQAWPVRPGSETSKIINAASINPFSTLVDMLQIAKGFENPLAPAPKYSSIRERVNPLFQDMWAAAGAEDPFGRNVGYAKAWLGVAGDLVPGMDDILQAAGAKKPSQVYEKQSYADTILRQGARVWPYTIDMAEAQDRAVSEGVALSTAQQRATRKILKQMRTARKLFRQSNGSQYMGRDSQKTAMDAYRRKADLDGVRARVDSEYEEGINRNRAKREAEVQLLVKWGATEPETAREYIKRIRMADEEELKRIQSVVTSVLTAMVHTPVRVYNEVAGYDPSAEEEK